MRARGEHWRGERKLTLVREEGEKCEGVETRTRDKGWVVDERER